MALYDPVDGVYRKVAKKYDPVDGVYRNVTKAYDPVDGVYRQYFSSDLTAGGLAVGDSIWLNVDGTLTEFLVVHQGNPDSALYDASCDGTWLLAKDVYEKRVWDSTNNDYANSDIHAYLNGTFLGLFDSGTRSAIKQVKIPYRKGTGTGGSTVSGSSGLSAKIFLLSGYEVGFTTSNHAYLPVAGACLSYFIGTSATDSKRIGYYNGTAISWWLRCPNGGDATFVFYVRPTGTLSSVFGTRQDGMRPAFILDSNTPFAQADGKNIIE